MLITNNIIAIIEELEKNNSRLKKEGILIHAFNTKNYEFFELLKRCYSPLVTYNVQKVPLLETESNNKTFTLTDFYKLLDTLEKRIATGNNLKNIIDQSANNCEMKLWNTVYRRVLLKDLKCGITNVTVNNVLKQLAKTNEKANDYIIPVFGCQLASDSEKHLKKLRGNYYLDPKLDGVRLLSILNKETNIVTQYTRKGKENNNFYDIVNSLSKLLPYLKESIVLDGEVVSTSFRDLMTQMNRKDEVDTSSAKLALFDVITMDDFGKGISVKPQYVRHRELCDLMTIIQDLKIDNIFVVPKMKINFDTTEGYESYINFNKECIDVGYEGIMIKSYDGIYESKRSSSWLKQKPFIELTLKIIDIVEGTGKNKGMMGNIVCTGTDDTGKILKVDVGGGFSDIERSDFWDNKEKYIDYMVEIRADAITKAQDSETYSLRFPRYKGLRGTEKHEKI